MATWKVTFEAPDAKLTAALKILGQLKMKFSIEQLSGLYGNVEDEMPGGNGALTVLNSAGKMMKTTVLSVGPREPALGTVAAKLVALLQKLEKQHGAHSVTRAQMNDAMKKANMSKTIISTGITNTIKSGYIKVTG